MRRLLAFIILSSVKIFSHIFFRAHYRWLSQKPENHWKKVKLIVFMNHTSLFEPIYCQDMPFSLLWELTGRVSVPGADVTLNRPIVGTFWKLMIPNISSVTRKKDNSWSSYLKSIRSDSLIMIAPEGRMKRPNGLDKFGKPMTVRGGVADIIETLNEGGILLCFSGGLHHVQSPGQHFPRLFQDIFMNFTYLDIAEYKKTFSSSPKERKLQIVQDLQERLERDCPQRV